MNARKKYLFLLCALFSSCAFSMDNNTNNSDSYSFLKKAAWVLFPAPSFVVSLISNNMPNFSDTNEQEEDKNQLFYEAIKNGNVRDVECYIQKHPNILTNYDKKQPSPIFYAIQCKQSDVLRVVLQNTTVKDEDIFEVFCLELDSKFERRVIELFLAKHIIQEGTFYKQFEDLLDVSRERIYCYSIFGAVFAKCRYGVLDLFLKKGYKANDEDAIKRVRNRINGQVLCPLQYMILAISKNDKTKNYTNSYDREQAQIILENTTINDAKMHAICWLLEYKADPLAKDVDTNNTIFHAVAENAPACDIVRYVKMVLWPTRLPTIELLLRLRKDQKCIWSKVPKPILMKIVDFIFLKNNPSFLYEKNFNRKTAYDILCDRSEKTNNPEEKKQFLAASILFSPN